MRDPQLTRQALAELNGTDALYKYAWFVGFLIAGGIYWPLDSYRRSAAR